MKIARVGIHLKWKAYHWVFKHDSQAYKFKYCVSQSVSASYLISLIQQTEIELVSIPDR